MINKVLLIIKKIVFAFGVLYGINIMLTNIGIIVPINFLTILIVLNAIIAIITNKINKKVILNPPKIIIYWTD